MSCVIMQTTGLTTTLDVSHRKSKQNQMCRMSIYCSKITYQNIFKNVSHCIENDTVPHLVNI